MIERARRERERGSATVELVILAPLFVALMVLVVAHGRVTNAHADVEGAARMAARELSRVRDPVAGLERARELAAASLPVGSATCRSMDFDATITTYEVTVSVACITALPEPVGAIEVPDSLVVSATATEYRDVHREYGS